MEKSMNDSHLSSIRNAIRDEMVPQIYAVYVESGDRRITIHVYHKEPISSRCIDSFSDVILARIYTEFPGSGFSSPEIGCEFHECPLEKGLKSPGIMIFPEEKK